MQKAGKGGIGNSKAGILLMVYRVSGVWDVEAVKFVPKINAKSIENIYATTFTVQVPSRRPWPTCPPLE